MIITFVEVPQEYGKDVLKSHEKCKDQRKVGQRGAGKCTIEDKTVLGDVYYGEAANGKDAMDQIEKLQPQIVLSDVVMPLMDGVDFTVAVHHRYPHIQMIILSGYDNFEYVKQTLMQGWWIISKSQPSHRMSFLACFKSGSADSRLASGSCNDRGNRGGTAQRIAARGNKNRRRTAKGICRILLLHVCGYDCAWE